MESSFKRQKSNSKIDLSKDPTFISPFLLASSTRNAKYCATAIQCLHSLLTIKAVALEQIDVVIDALQEATHLGVDIQLKILQSLPSLIENYGQELSSEQIVNILHLCSILQGGNKTVVVVNTASATLQQLIISVFERVAKEDKNAEKVPPKKTFEVAVDSVDGNKINGEIGGGSETGKILISPVAYDALMIFIDLCNLTEKQKPIFLKKFNHLPETFGLELLESIMTNHSDIFLRHIEFAYVLRTRVVPLLLRAFSEKREFSVTVRVTRILYLLLRRQLPVLKVEGEVILSLLTHMLDKDAAPYWKRLLCMEVFQGVCSEFSLVQEIYQEYDAQQGTRRAIIKCLIAAFEKISIERKDIIGYGPVSMPFQLPDDNGNGVSESNTLHDENDPVDYSDVVGISLKTSVARVPCIDLLDKGEPPIVPESYLYYLVLLCINSLSEGLARKVFSQTSSSSSASEMSIQFLSQCWREISACYQTFFHATIDLDLYHSLVRSVQKLAHSTGFLNLVEPRDSFLSLLGEFSVLVIGDFSGGRKSSIGSSATASTSSVATTASNMARNLLSVESIVGSLGSIREHQRSASNAGLPTPASPVSPSRPSSGSGQSTGIAPGMPTSRNILCFRALLNVAHTLGPTLSTSWDIIFKTIQSSDALVNGSGKKRGRNVKGSHVFSQLGADFNPVDNSFRRLLDSTKDFPESSFLDMISSLCRISEQILGIQKPSTILNGDLFFGLDLLGELGIINMNRLLSPADKTWEQLTDHLLKVIDTRSVDTAARSHSSNVLNDLIIRASTDAVTAAAINSQAQRKVIQTLKCEINRVIKIQVPSEDSSIVSTESDIHVSSIDTLNKVLDHCGGKIIDGWDLVFDVIDTVFTSLFSVSSSTSLSSMSANTSSAKQTDRTARLVKSGFESLNFICNDFLVVLPQKCLMNLVVTLSKFCNQESDLNISFTSISFFWTVSDHLRNMLSERNAVSKDFSEPIADSEKLSEVAVNGEFPLNIHALWIISLLRLAITAGDPRAQVRNGSIQILFRILDSNGNSLPVGVWKTVQTIVTPILMKVRPPSNMAGKELISSWIETMTLVLNGFSNLYSSFINQFVNQDDFVKLWSGLIDYFQTLIEVDQPHLSLPVYNALDGILTSLSKNKVTIQFPVECLEKAWEFWTSQPIPKNPVDAKLIQESLTVLVQIHEPLYELSNYGECSYENLAKTIAILQRCTTFAHIPQLYSDREHMSPLQSKSLSRIEAIDVTDCKVASLILNLLCDFLVLPFNTEDRVNSNDSTSKRPTFISLAAESLKMLQKNLGKVSSTDYEELCENKTIENIFSSSVLLMEKKFNCPLISPKISDDNAPLQMWQSATQIFLFVSEKLLHSVMDNLKSEQRSNGIWEYILKSGIAIISNSSTSPLQFELRYETFDCESYKRFINLVENSNSTSDEFWARLLRALFESSAIYYRGKFNQSYYRNNLPEESLQRLINGPFYGHTEKAIPLSRINLSHLCLNELFRLSSRPPKNSPIVIEKSSQYLTWRAAIILHQYVADQPLRGRTPMPKICRLELIGLLKSILKYHAESNMSKLFSLISASISVSYNDAEILALLQKCILNIGHGENA